MIDKQNQLIITKIISRKFPFQNTLEKKKKSLWSYITSLSTVANTIRLNKNLTLQNELISYCILWFETG